ncbi:hypothetical protein ACKKBF_B09325 [Auxenochlorella protothecoides x Auxenochlorella symbiontica]
MTSPVELEKYRQMVMTQLGHAFLMHQQSMLPANSPSHSSLRVAQIPEGSARENLAGGLDTGLRPGRGDDEPASRKRKPTASQGRTPPRKKQDGFWTAAMRFMASQGEELATPAVPPSQHAPAHQSASARVAEEHSARLTAGLQVTGLADGGGSSMSGMCDAGVPGVLDPVSAGDRPRSDSSGCTPGPPSFQHGPVQHRAVPALPFPSMDPALLEMARQAMVATAVPFPPDYEPQLPKLLPEATFDLVASPPSAGPAHSSGSAAGAQAGTRPLHLKFRSGAAGAGAAGDAAGPVLTPTAPGLGRSAGPAAGGTPDAVPSLELTGAELARLLATPQRPLALGLGPLTPFSAFLMDQAAGVGGSTADAGTAAGGTSTGATAGAAAVTPQAVAGLGPLPAPADSPMQMAYLDGLLLDLNFGEDAGLTAPGAPEQGAFALPAQTPAGGKAVLHHLQSPAVEGLTQPPAGLHCQASPGLPGLMSPSLLAAALPEDF